MRSWLASVTLAVRVGINTGEVVVGDPAEGHFYASGDAVNVAARLEQAAEPGEILLGETTYRLVRDAVAVDARGSLALKGKSDAVGAHRLRELIKGAPALARRFAAAEPVGWDSDPRGGHGLGRARPCQRTRRSPRRRAHPEAKEAAACRCRIRRRAPVGRARQTARSTRSRARRY
jgi:hypothetical protein